MDAGLPDSAAWRRAWSSGEGRSLPFLGEPAHASVSLLETVEDLLPRERVVALVLCALALVGGFLPGPLLRLSEHKVETLVEPSVAGAHASREESGAPTGPRQARTERARSRR